DKLSDILDGYKARKAQIGRAALENCSLEQEALFHCYSHGSTLERSTLCRSKDKAFNRCYIMQAVRTTLPPLPEKQKLKANQPKNQRFLKALGYLSTTTRASTIDEQIQMHADTLYHRMLDQESAIAAAKASDTPLPEFPPLFPQKVAPQPLAIPPSTNGRGEGEGEGEESPEAEAAAWLSRLKPDVRRSLEEKWRGMDAGEKAIEARAVVMEMDAGVDTARRVEEHMRVSRRGKEERRQRGTASWGDTVSGWFGW
ncbi:MAG: hypothetical protein Q9190_005723, partial [Brigantiaea leucoxantha]